MNQEQALQRYTSPNQWFEVMMPAGWTAEQEHDDVTAFYDPAGAGGTLRVSAVAITGPEGEPANMTAVLREKWKSQSHPTNFEANYRDLQGAVRYDQELEEEGTRLHQRCWELAQGNVLLVFSYTHEAPKWDSEAVRKELETATAIVASLQFLK